jgi:hypothetical protein
MREEALLVWEADSVEFGLKNSFFKKFSKVSFSCEEKVVESLSALVDTVERFFSISARDGLGVAHCCVTCSLLMTETDRGLRIATFVYKTVCVLGGCALLESSFKCWKMEYSSFSHLYDRL